MMTRKKAHLRCQPRVRQHVLSAITKPTVRSGDELELARARVQQKRRVRALLARPFVQQRAPPRLAPCWRRARQVEPKCNAVKRRRKRAGVWNLYIVEAVDNRARAASSNTGACGRYDK